MLLLLLLLLLLALRLHTCCWGLLRWWLVPLAVQQAQAGQAREACQGWQQ
jgi:hypothetical protein